jgi:hypothetical protein
MNFLSDKSIGERGSGDTADAAPGLGLLPFARLRHQCAYAECPERRRLWPRWRARSEEILFEGKRYCCAVCAEAAFEREIERHLLLAQPDEERPHRVPLGLLLVSRGLITSAQLQEALQRQREQPGTRLGRLLLEADALSETALTATLGKAVGLPGIPAGSQPLLYGMHPAATPGPAAIRRRSAGASLSCDGGVSSGLHPARGSYPAVRGRANVRGCARCRAWRPTV